MPRKERLTVTVDASLVVAGNQAVAAGRAESLSAWVNLALAGASMAFTVADNHSKGRTWSYGLLHGWDWELGSVVGGATSLLVRSEEEALYDEYQFVVARTRG